MRTGNTLGTARSQIRTCNIDRCSDRFILGGAGRWFARRIAVKFDADVAVHASQSGRGIHDKTDQGERILQPRKFSRSESSVDAKQCAAFR